ncbi:MAG TPA: hypothetical protein DCS11_09945 [Syntrophus sp. (in: bacteria)]|jgi:hypothetical protein|nr:hypothetical protein [Syntrophus sp. (in: bacteria)]
MFFKSGKKNGFEGGGLVLFDSVEEAMSGERALKAAEVENRLVAPPPELRRGCDLALEINLVEKPAVERMLRSRQVPFIDILPMKGDAELLQVVQVTDFGEAVMVKAGNMKLTFDKSSGVVLNISGGGCPDIPYLHAQMLDKPLDRAPRPKEMGHTLCSLMLDRAYVQSLEIWKNGGR